MNEPAAILLSIYPNNVQSQDEVDMAEWVQLCRMRSEICYIPSNFLKCSLHAFAHLINRQFYDIMTGWQWYRFGSWVYRVRKGYLRRSVIGQRQFDESCGCELVAIIQIPFSSR